MTGPQFTTRLWLVLTSVTIAAAPIQAASLSASDLFLLNRVTWGINEPTANAMQALGREAWLQQQLHPSATDRLPEAAQAQIDAMPISQRPMLDIVTEFQARNKALNTIKDPVEKQPAAQAYQQALTDTARQAAARHILRALYSPAQLREQMTWFWFNHFNVHQYKADIRPMLADYEETAIRPHALGRFRDLLGATARHPAMLRYLDNAENYAGHLNENFAREIMELHTMGVGAPYTQDDIQELARILTGYGITTRTDTPKLKPELQAQYARNGLFEFNPNRHDFGDKTFLGQTIKASGQAELDEAMDIISRHPATAKRLSHQIAMFFLGDNPPEAAVTAMAATWEKTDGDIAAVLSTLFHSQAFTKPDLTATRFKDPVHYVFSALRLAYNDRVVLNTLPAQNWLNRMAEGLYNKETPDGYPAGETAWSGPGALAVRFEVARQIGSGGAGLFKPDAKGATEQPGFPQLQNALYFDRIRATLSPATQEALSRAISPQDWNTLYLASPEFMY
jgi:uncharacterized protein (DUF1800 family)